MSTEEGEIVKRMFQIRAFLDEFIVEGIGPQLENIGFSRKGKNTLTRKHGECYQEVYILFRRLTGQEAGYIQVFIAIRFDAVEKLSFELQGETPRKKWPTASLNIGNLQEKREFIEWRLDEKTDISALSLIVMDWISRYAFPLWESFSTIPTLLQGYLSKDPRLLLNGSYEWRLAAAYRHNGQTDEAIRVLEEWNKGRPAENMIEKAVERLRE